MKQSIKTASCLLLVLAMLLTFIGCDTTETPSNGTTTTTTTTAPTGDVPTDPSDATTPSDAPTDPSDVPTDPSDVPTDPSDTPTDPSDTPTEPSDTPTEPSQGTTQKPTATKEPPKPTQKTDKPTTTAQTTTTTFDGKEDTIKVGNLTIHSGATPFVTGGTLEISMFIPYINANVTADKQAATKYYETLSGIKMNYNYYQGSDIFVLKSTMLQAGNVPDIMMSVPVGFNCADAEKYGKDGFFADLTNRMQTWAPNLYAKLNSGDYDYSKVITYAPGKVYSLPSLHLPLKDQTTRYDEFQCMINTVWLDELGLDIPTTVAEFEKVCRAFTLDDPDGNGKADTYGWGAPYWCGQIFNPWGLAMSYYCKGSISEKGEVVSSLMTDNIRYGVRFYNKMWKNGYINQKMFGASESARKSLIAKTGIVSMSQIGNYLSESELKNWTVMQWPDAPQNEVGDFKSGVTTQTYSDGYENMFFISAKTKSVEACMRWLDYFYTPDGAMLWNYGPVGTAYTKIGSKYKMKKDPATLAQDQKIISSYTPMAPVNIMDRNATELTTREKWSAGINKETLKFENPTWHFYWLDQLKNANEQAKLDKLKYPGDDGWLYSAIKGVDADIENGWNSYKTTNGVNYTQWKEIYQGVFNRFFR